MSIAALKARQLTCFAGTGRTPSYAQLRAWGIVAGSRMEQLQQQPEVAEAQPVAAIATRPVIAMNAVRAVPALPVPSAMQQPRLLPAKRKMEEMEEVDSWTLLLDTMENICVATKHLKKVLLSDLAARKRELEQQGKTLPAASPSPAAKAVTPPAKKKKVSTPKRLRQLIDDKQAVLFAPRKYGPTNALPCLVVSSSESADSQT